MAQRPSRFERIVEAASPPFLLEYPRAGMKDRIGSMEAALLMFDLWTRATWSATVSGSIQPHT
ncbi:MAG TPA: hypothetical protein VFC78_03935, partial [Tepidisphaeraceae bacterium]|nr:hypothetical protein [Tepidisphaeraceae bacterium]